MYISKEGLRNSVSFRSFPPGPAYFCYHYCIFRAGPGLPALSPGRRRAWASELEGHNLSPCRQPVSEHPRRSLQPRLRKPEGGRRRERDLREGLLEETPDVQGSLPLRCRRGPCPLPPPCYPSCVCPMGRHRGHWGYGEQVAELAQLPLRLPPGWLAVC